MLRKIRTLRHWKQRFHPQAAFVFRRPMKYGDNQYEAGDLIPEDLSNNVAKLRRFWEAQAIELAEFEAPDVVTGRAPEPKAEDDDAPDDPPADEEDPEDAETDEADASDAEATETTEDNQSPTEDDETSETEDNSESEGEDAPEDAVDEDNDSDEVDEGSVERKRGEVYKIADRNWRVEGLEKKFLTKRSALTAAEKLEPEDDEDFLA